MSDLDEYLKDKPYTLTQEQYAYCNDAIYGDKHVSNFSGGGCGKSLCLEIIKSVLGDRCVVCSTTGISNSILFNNKGGHGTAASVFSIPNGLYNSYHEKKVGKLTSNLFASSDLVTTCIVEEAGMLNPNQLDLIRKRIIRYNRPYGKKRGKRNIKLILQGDLLQLGSVITKQEEIDYMRKEYGSELLFESSVFNEIDFNTHIFTENKRTGDHVFQAALDVLRYGQEHRYGGVLKWLNKRYLKAPEGCLKVATTNRRVDELNREALDSNPNPAVKLKAVVEGDFDIKSCPADKDIVLKVGLPVISLMNSEEGNFFNGSFGHVKSIVVGEGVVVEFLHSGEEHLVPYFTYEQAEYFTDTDEKGEAFMNMKTIGTFTQVSIKVAAAFSCHRMQGKTVDVPMELDLGNGFPSNQNNPWGMALASVAIGRLTRIENLYLRTRLNRSHLKTNDRAVNWVLDQMGY